MATKCFAYSFWQLYVACCALLGIILTSEYLNVNTPLVLTTKGANILSIVAPLLAKQAKSTLIGCHVPTSIVDNADEISISAPQSFSHAYLSRRLGFLLGLWLGLLRGGKLYLFAQAVKLKT